MQQPVRARQLSSRFGPAGRSPNVRVGSGTVFHFTAMSGSSMTDTGASCPIGSCALLSRHSVDLFQRRQSTLLGHPSEVTDSPLRRDCGH